nr:transposase [Rhodococcus sp. JVH1]
MLDGLSLRLVPDALWETVEPLIPRFAARPQGGGSAPVDDRAVFNRDRVRADQWMCVAASAALVRGHRSYRAPKVYRLGGGRVFDRLHREVLDRLGSAGELDWTAAILDAASVRAKKGDR